MRAVPLSPPTAPDETISGLSCPECFGVLGVSIEGQHGTLRFRCRTGHLYSAEEVIIGKEKRIEEFLWGAVTYLNELATLLTELAPKKDDSTAKGYRERATRAAEQQELLRRVILENEPTSVEGGPDPQTGRG